MRPTTSHIVKFHITTSKIVHQCAKATFTQQQMALMFKTHSQSLANLVFKFENNKKECMINNHVASKL
jgi:uncharacterized membrane protein (UPF0127 family)